MPNTKQKNCASCCLLFSSSCSCCVIFSAGSMHYTRSLIKIFSTALGTSYSKDAYSTVLCDAGSAFNVVLTRDEHGCIKMQCQPSDHSEK